MTRYHAGPKNSSATIQAFPLPEHEKHHPAMRHRFRRAATLFANRLALSSEPDNRQKNTGLARGLSLLITNAHYDIFSRVNPAMDSTARKPSNLVFKLRAHRNAEDEHDTWVFAKNGSVAIPAPQRKLSLPRDENGDSFIPVGTAARITLPLRPETMEISGGNTGRQLAKIARSQPASTLAKKADRVVGDVEQQGRGNSSAPRHCHRNANGGKRAHP